MFCLNVENGETGVLYISHKIGIKSIKFLFGKGRERQL
jgi:hypothetical protein